MLTIFINDLKLFDEAKNKFYKIDPLTVKLEHSLKSLSKWESIWLKPFFVTKKGENRTIQEIQSYIECMIIGDFPDYIVHVLKHKYFDVIQKYINSPHTGTKIHKNNNSLSVKKQTITSEIIYSWMIFLNIPFSADEWHLNNLLTLIDICNEKNSKPKKLSKSEQLARQHELNEQRLKKYNTKG